MPPPTLLHRLKAAGIPENAYTLFSTPRDETLTIQGLNGTWIVFYAERGLKTGLRVFQYKSEAEEYFFNEIYRWFNPA